MSMKTKLCVTITAAVFAVALSQTHGTCGHECIADNDCVEGLCPSAKCSCPDKGTKFPAISCTCVSAPPNAPSSPEALVEDSVWPAKWVANVTAQVYTTFAHIVNGAKGKFFYDGEGGHSRAEWTPYTNQKDATQVWIGGTNSAKSNYYVKSGPLCISFPITDPGSVGGPVSVERADWMVNCNASGMAQYMGREQVHVNEEGVWADHWSCHTEYSEVNQSITFQNWHSLGLNSLPKGLPLRVTGGNSAPNPTKGSPRLSTVWYSDFKTGNDSVSDKDFEKPSFLCIPVAMETSEAFFGHKVTRNHVFDPAFHARAHALPAHIAGISGHPTEKDVSRAVQVVPGSAFSGSHFAGAMSTLNTVLEAEYGLSTRPCASFDLPELHAVQRVLFEARAPQLQEVYTGVNDTRSLAHTSASELEAEQAAVMDLAHSHPEVADMVRDGVCHETVMWYVHHLSEATKHEVQQLIVLPLLPEKHHEKPTSEATKVAEGHARYTSQVSCAVCHVV